MTPARSQEIQDGVNVLKLLGSVSRENYLEAMWIMDYNYPAHGWNEAAKDLEAFYEQLEKREQKKREVSDPIDSLHEQILPDLRERTQHSHD